MHNAELPHVVHAVVMEPKTVSTVRSIHEKFDVFTDAVRGDTLPENANNDANIRDKHEYSGKTWLYLLFRQLLKHGFCLFLCQGPHFGNPVKLFLFSCPYL